MVGYKIGSEIVFLFPNKNIRCDLECLRIVKKAHIHTDITTCNIEESQQKYRIGTVSNVDCMGWGRGCGA